jgi:N-acetylglucosaminyldiphosphoundecaprenol N-acetyl-beta-D-mannosaminyltransferase
VAQKVRSIDARIILVALGAPKQEYWIQEWLEVCGANVGIGIGSALDIISGDKPRAPKWMRDHGLEWLHRMMLEPRRLGKRYIMDDSPFVALLVMHLLQNRLRTRTARKSSGAGE